MNSNKPDILTALDEAHDSPIYTALLIGDMKSLIKIANYIKEKEITKVQLDEESLGSIATVVESPQSDELTPIGIIDDYLRPLYTADSIESLIKLIGEDTIYGYV